MVDTLNFAFWSDSDVLFTVEYRGKRYNGYWSLCAAINRALDVRIDPTRSACDVLKELQESIPITDPHYMANITEEQLKHIFRHPLPHGLAFRPSMHR